MKRKRVTSLRLAAIIARTLRKFRSVLGDRSIRKAIETSSRKITKLGSEPGIESFKILCDKSDI